MRTAIDMMALLPQTTVVDTYLKQLVLHFARVDQRNRYVICHGSAIHI